MPTLVEIVPYDLRWPHCYAGIEAELIALLGNTVAGIDHIGSTAVPGMPAKPVIDIDVTLRDPTCIAQVADALVGAGFEARGNRHNDDVWAFLRRGEKLAERVYLCTPGNETHQKRITFRDFLRGHKDAAEVYAGLKYQLAAQYPYDGDRYTAAKREFIDDILTRARNLRL